MSDPPPLDRAIADQFSRVETTLCLSKKVIVITEDQLELRAQDGIQKLSARNAWVAPLGIFITCLATILTAGFKDFSWIRSGAIKGLWIAVTLGSAVWLLTSLSRMTKFGRREFMESIRAAGIPYLKVTWKHKLAVYVRVIPRYYSFKRKAFRGGS
jgi:hypothetical protein